ncbi:MULTISPECIES: GTPase [unclassified Microcoleus]|uniref:GTPase n=1 Tax=unclassified Microcoleus TaxID=2642155 RepID=UPI002FCEE236
MVNDVSTAYDPAWDDNSFFTKVEILTEQASPDFSKTLNMAFIGKVSSGKSSLINAFLKRDRVNILAAVGAKSGVTTKLKILQLNEHFRLIDSPGLDDVRSENTQVTKEFLEHIDVGVLVVTGSSDGTQKKYIDDLRASCSRIFVVLNKIDQWDRNTPSTLEGIKEQWKTDLHIDEIYPVCAFGYDPETKSNEALDVRGVDELRIDIESFLQGQGKDLLFARQMAEKQSYAIKIIASALVAVSGQVFIPGSAAFIVATQASAIASLYYIYNGKALAPKAAIALLSSFASEAISSNIFLFVQSFIPPTGLLDIPAVIAAITTTVAMLATVNNFLATGAKLEEKQRLQEAFRKNKAQATKEFFFNIDLEKLRNPDYIRETVKRFIMGQAIA